jgi:PAS domain-containing protein
LTWKLLNHLSSYGILTYFYDSPASLAADGFVGASCCPVSERGEQIDRPIGRCARRGARHVPLHVARTGAGVNLGLFKAITGPLPNPVLLCEADGTVLAANPAAASILTLPPDGGTLVQDEAGQTAFRRQMAGWMRTGSPLPGALDLRDARGAPVRFRCHGARATWWTGPRPAVQLHLSRLGESDQFAALTQQVRALNREIAVRRVAHAERAQLLAAEQAARSRLQHLYRLTAALAACNHPGSRRTRRP